jgi:hypothetical protein
MTGYTEVIHFAVKRAARTSAGQVSEMPTNEMVRRLIDLFRQADRGGSF